MCLGKRENDVIVGMRWSDIIRGIKFNDMKHKSIIRLRTCDNETIAIISLLFFV